MAMMEGIERRLTSLEKRYGKVLARLGALEERAPKATKSTPAKKVTPLKTTGRPRVRT